MEGWDLSCVRALGCGAEPIHAGTVRAFLDKFEPVGLQRTAILPSYGMAEATLAVTFADSTSRSRPTASTRTRCAAGARRARATGTPWRSSRAGAPSPRIASTSSTSAGTPSPSGRSARSWSRGRASPRATSATRHTGATFRDGRLLTGDLGYFADGRALRLRAQQGPHHPRGRNYYPQDIEKIISDVEGMRTSQVGGVHLCAQPRSGDKPRLAERPDGRRAPGRRGRGRARRRSRERRRAPRDRRARCTSRWASGRRGTLPAPRGAAQDVERQSSPTRNPSAPAGGNPRLATVARSKRGIDQRPGSSFLRRLQRVLPALARRADELHVRRLRDPEPVARGRAAEQARASCPTSRTSRRSRRCSTSAAAGARTSSTSPRRAA